MRKRVAAIWVSLVIILSIVVIIVEVPEPVQAGTTWTVDDDGPADFSKIQDAINASSDGDTVFVYSGTYYENLWIDQSINLTGEDRNTTKIIGDGEDYGIFVNVNCVNISSIVKIL